MIIPCGFDDSIQRQKKDMFQSCKPVSFKAPPPTPCRSSKKTKYDAPNSAPNQKRRMVSHITTHCQTPPPKFHTIPFVMEDEQLNQHTQVVLTHPKLAHVTTVDVQWFTDSKSNYVNGEQQIELVTHINDQCPFKSDLLSFASQFVLKKVVRRNNRDPKQTYACVEKIQQQQDTTKTHLLPILLVWQDGSDQELYELTPYCSHIDIKRIEFNYPIFIQMVSQMSKAFDTLHNTHKVLHMDIKPANIFVHQDEKSKEFTFLLGDLESLKELNSTDDFFIEGSGIFIAPEVLNRSVNGLNTINQQSNIYSFGVLLDYYIEHNKNIQDNISSELKSFISSMKNPLQHERPLNIIEIFSKLV